MADIDWDDLVKRLLKSELVKRGVSYEELVFLLKEQGCCETKSSVESKISRGRFSATFLIQSLNAIGCTVLYTTPNEEHNVVAEKRAKYKTARKK